MKQIGHSVESLYKNTSMACPLTKGSLGSWISRGTISVGEFLNDEVNEAKVLDLGRKGDEECVGDVGVLGEGRPNTGCDGEVVVEVSDAADCDRPEMGTIRF